MFLSLLYCYLNVYKQPGIAVRIFIFIALSVIIRQLCCGQNFKSGVLPATAAKSSEPEGINAVINKNNLSSLFLSFNYSSNTNTFGNFSQFVKQPSYSPSIFYFSKHGFDISGTAYWIENSDDSLRNTTSELDISAGYNFQFIRNLNIYPCYSHFFYNEKANTLKSSFSDDISLYIYYQMKWFLPGLSSNYLIGDDNTFFFTVHNSFTFSKEGIFFRNSSLDFLPGIDISFSNQSYYVNYFWESLYSSTSLRDFLRDYPEVRIKYLALRYTYPNLTNAEILTIIGRDYREKKEEMRLSNIGIYFPVSYMAGNFIFDFTLLTYFPVNQPDYFNDEIQVYFNLGVSYLIDIRW